MISMITSFAFVASCLGCDVSTPQLGLQPEANTKPIEISVDLKRNNFAAAEPLEFNLDTTFKSLQSLQAPKSDLFPAYMAKEEQLPSFNVTEVDKFQAEWTLTLPSSQSGFGVGGIGLDLSLAPRAGVARNGDFRSAMAGAEVRFGQNLVELAEYVDQRGEFARVDSWYLFAATDGEALCWDLGDKGTSFEGVKLRDQVTVGDVQAGFAVHKAGGELSLGYVRREFSQEGVSHTAEFAAVSFTMRR